MPTFLEPSTNDSLVDACRDKMRMGLTEEWSLEHSAQQFSVTPRTLSRRFVNATGLSPIYYLTKQRLDMARKFVEIDQSTGSENCGTIWFLFNNGFLSQFQKKFSQTLGLYRKSLPEVV